MFSPFGPDLGTQIKHLPTAEPFNQVMACSSIWNMAMREQMVPQLISWGTADSMIRLLRFALDPETGEDWLDEDQRIYLPYYCSHILGSLAFEPKWSRKVVDAGALPVLIPLAEGALTWVERRAAARAIGNITLVTEGGRSKFEESLAIAAADAGAIGPILDLCEHALEILMFEELGVPEEEKNGYIDDLLTRGDPNLDPRTKAVEWGLQMHHYSITAMCHFSRAKPTVPRLVDANIISRWERISEFVLVPSHLDNSENYASFAVETLCNVLKESEIARSQLTPWHFQHLKYLLFATNINLSHDIISVLPVLARDSHKEMISHNYLPVLHSLLQWRLPEGNEDKMKLDRKSIRAAMKILLYDVKDSFDNKDEWRFKFEGYISKKANESKLSVNNLRELQKKAIKLKEEGNAQFKSEKYQEAINKYMQALDECPFRDHTTTIAICSNISECCIRLGKYEDALCFATRATCLDPDHEKSIHRKMTAFSKLEEWAAAYREINHLLEIGDNAKNPAIRQKMEELGKKCNFILVIKERGPLYKSK